MTDKQIIIDGCDVSGCVKLRPYNECGCQPNYGGSYGLCSEWKNCYYKRMMHTGAELNIHKNDKEHAYKRIAELQEQLKRKEEECERLKEARKNSRCAWKSLEGTLCPEVEQLLKRKEQELQEAMDNYVKLDNQRVKEYNELVDKYNNKEQELEQVNKAYEACKESRLKAYNILQEKEQECEALKVENKELQEQLDQPR